jgi:hypothetical protein
MQCVDVIDWSVHDARNTSLDIHLDAFMCDRLERFANLSCMGDQKKIVCEVKLVCGARIEGFESAPGGSFL